MEVLKVEEPFLESPCDQGIGLVPRGDKDGMHQTSAGPSYDDPLQVMHQYELSDVRGISHGLHGLKTLINYHVSNQEWKALSTASVEELVEWKIGLNGEKTLSIT
mmetsp:Transcript_32856/g.38258  ORF Transcript_32856/g.38258 Transcript_32856/m.38258 type:complete len:105 (+) Transcript_32856:860-1174(+)